MVVYQRRFEITDSSWCVRWEKEEFSVAADLDSSQYNRGGRRDWGLTAVVARIGGSCECITLVSAGRTS